MSTDRIHIVDLRDLRARVVYQRGDEAFLTFRRRIRCKVILEGRARFLSSLQGPCPNDEIWVLSQADSPTLVTKSEETTQVVIVDLRHGHEDIAVLKNLDMDSKEFTKSVKRSYVDKTRGYLLGVVREETGIEIWLVGYEPEYD